jgi:mercuric transport protein
MTKLVGPLALGAVLALSGSCSRNVSAQQSAEKTTRTQTIALSVEGMTCAACSVTVRAALKKLDGVKDAKVTVSDKRVVVEYEPEKVTPQQMVDAVNKLGYQASLPAARSS